MNESKETEQFIAEYGKCPDLYEDRERHYIWKDRLTGALWRAELDRTEELEDAINQALGKISIGDDNEAHRILVEALAEQEEL